MTGSATLVEAIIPGVTTSPQEFGRICRSMPSWRMRFQKRLIHLAYHSYQRPAVVLWGEAIGGLAWTATREEMGEEAAYC